MARRPKGWIRLCRINGCRNEHYGKGFCRLHYSRWKRNGDPLKVFLKKSCKEIVCLIRDCQKKHYAKGYCKIHYLRWHRKGDPNMVEITGPKKGWEHPNTLKAIKSPTIGEIQWAAGFLEGEGSFGKRIRFNRHCEASTATQVNKEPLEKLLQIFGGAISFDNREKSRLKGQNRQDCYIWRAHGSRSRGIMMTVFPFMSQKRKNQIKSALSCQS